MIGKKGILNWMAAAVAAVALVGCGGGGGGGGATAFKPAIFVINASPDAAAINLKVNGKDKATGLGFLQTSPTFQNVEVGDLDVELFADGNPESFDARVLPFADNQNTIVVASGVKAFGDEYEKRLKINRFEVDRNRPNSEAHVYCLHALNFPAGQYTTQVLFKTPGKNPQFTTADIAFGTAPLLKIDAGKQTISVRRSGTETDFVTADLTLEPGGIYLAVAGGVVGQTSGAKRMQIKLIRLDAR